MKTIHSFLFTLFALFSQNATPFEGISYYNGQIQTNHNASMYDSLLISQTVLSDSIFLDKVYIHKMIFLNNVSFDYSQFASKAIFSNSLFRKNVSFQSSKFDSLSYFSGVIFYHQTEFIDTEFSEPFIAKNVQFYSKAAFDLAQYKSLFSLSYSEFSSDVLFGNTSFSNNAHFIGVKFLRKADFRFAEFFLTANFSNSKFNGQLDFRETVFGTKLQLNSLQSDNKIKVDFENTQLPDTLELHYNESIFDEIDLRLTKLDSLRKRAGNSNRKCKISLIGTDINSIKINYKNFQLYFPQELNLSFSDTVKVYESLIRSLEKQGETSDKKKFHIEFKKLVYQKNGQWIQDKFDWVLFNYGYDFNNRIVLIGLVLFTLFIIINKTKIDILNTHVYTLDIVTNYLELSKSSRGVNKIKYGYISALLYTSILFFGVKFEIDHFQKTKFRYMLWVLIIYFIGIVWSLLFLKFILKLS